MKMMDYLRRFKSQPQNSQQNILSYVFFYITFTYGVSYGFFFHTPAVQATAMATLAIPPLMWGFFSMVVILSVIFTIFFKWRKLAKFTGIAGFMLWVYVAFMAIITTSWFPLIVLITP